MFPQIFSGRLQWRSCLRLYRSMRKCAFSTNTGQNNKPTGGDSGGGMFPELDEETKKQKQRKQQIILERMRRSKLADAMRMENEKLFEAGAKPLAEQDSFIFPDTEIEPLFEDASDSLEPLSIHGLARRSDVSLLTLSFNGIGKQQANAFNNVFLDVFNPPGRSAVGDSQTNIIDIHYYDGLVYSILKRFLKNGLRKNTQQQSPQLKDYSYVKFERYVPQTEVSMYLQFWLPITQRVLLPLEDRNSCMMLKFTIVLWDTRTCWIAREE
eukprot:gb/GECG01005801.1/.p1 GENE.gb/GECG01005801.1/~~gb/GECG01005801.1/.p1  ORF type:complete len:268 (+),score=33.20 gb/GECG01005801.1/:1-804(+)